MSCRLALQGDLTLRMVHEASLYENNAFVTLTLSDEKYPADGSGSLRQIQLFMMRLRKMIYPARVRFVAVSEYGSKGWRLHYHLILFGYDFADKYIWGQSPNGHWRFRSATLEKLWTDPKDGVSYGHCELGSVTPESCAYVGKYVLKKVGGSVASKHYLKPHAVTGQLVRLRPEFSTMSKKPGLGSGWFDKFECDAFPSDSLRLGNRSVRVPRYYDRKLKGRSLSPDSRPDDLVPKDDLTPIRRKRRVNARKPSVVANSTPERLATRAEVLRLKLASRQSGELD